ncbi:MAG: hypothetical protein LBI33_11600 [Propionibacteriaceae bacterium]|jgi:hypothetical protein|nr:hypothetical protein [Propionibacteriaceae bacterium]
MYPIAATAFMILGSLIFFGLGLVWGGPWPPKPAIADGRAKEHNLSSVRLSTVVAGILFAFLVWRVDVITNIWLRYVLVVLVPLLLGVLVRRVLLWREDRPATTP